MVTPCRMSVRAGGPVLAGGVAGVSARARRPVAAARGSAPRLPGWWWPRGPYSCSLLEHACDSYGNYLRKKPSFVMWRSIYLADEVNEKEGGDVAGAGGLAVAASTVAASTAGEAVRSASKPPKKYPTVSASSTVYINAAQV